MRSIKARFEEQQWAYPLHSSFINYNPKDETKLIEHHWKLNLDGEGKAKRVESASLAKENTKDDRMAIMRSKRLKKR